MFCPHGSFNLRPVLFHFSCSAQLGGQYQEVEAIHFTEQNKIEEKWVASSIEKAAHFRCPGGLVDQALLVLWVQAGQCAFSWLYETGLSCAVFHLTCVQPLLSCLLNAAELFFFRLLWLHWSDNSRTSTSFLFTTAKILAVYRATHTISALKKNLHLRREMYKQPDIEKKPLQMRLSCLGLDKKKAD